MRFVCFAICVFLSTSSLADTLLNKSAAKKLAQDVMNKISKDKTMEALDLVEPYLIIPESEFDVMKNKLAMQQPMIAQRFGKTVGIELIETQEVGSSLLLITYIQKFEKHPMRWKFYFYKPTDSWVLNTFNFDDKMQLMFDGM